MLKRLSLIAVLALAAGCTGGDSFKPSVGIANVSPSSVAQGRTKTVTITGNFTKWNDSISSDDISFGADITVGQVTVATREYIQVEITAAPGAAVGTRDVSVDDETFVGVFEVKPPFEIVASSAVRQGHHLYLEILGNDTDWLAGLTRVEVEEGDIYGDFGYVFSDLTTEVLREDYIVATMFIDVFAPAGARTLSINGVAFDDSIAGALTVEAVTPAALTSGVLATGDFAAPFESDLFTVPAALIGDVHDFEVSRSASSDLSQPVGVFYTDDSGLDPIGFAYNIGGFFGFDLVPFQERYFAPGKDLILVMTDFGLGGGADDYGYKIDFAKTAAVALTAATPDTGNTIAASGDTNWYFTTAANKWNVVTFTATPTGAAQLDGMVFGFRKGAVQDNELPFVDATGTGAPESLKFLAGSSLRAFVGVADFFDAFGADTQHDAGFTEAAIPGVLVESQTTNVPLVDALNAELGITEATMNVASVTPIVAGTLYLAVDLDHTWISDLSIQLESPLGTVVTVSNGFGGSDDGIIDVFGASGQPGTTRNASALSAFNGEVPTGLWTVRFIDDTEADTGLLRGVAIAIP